MVDRINQAGVSSEWINDKKKENNEIYSVEEKRTQSLKVKINGEEKENVREFIYLNVFVNSDVKDAIKKSSRESKWLNKPSVIQAKSQIPH